MPPMLRARGIGSRIGGAALRDFARGLKAFVGVGGAVLAENATRFLRATRTGLSSLDEIARLVDVGRARRGFVTMGEQTVGAFRGMVRAADLDGLARTSRVNVTVTSAERSAFRDAMSGTPERALKDVDDTRVRAAQSNLDLDVTDSSRLTPTARTKLGKVTANLTKALGKGTVFVMVLGTVAVSADWAITATQRRKGCFMMTTIDGKSTSCKVAAYTCHGPKEGNLCTREPNYYNATLVLMHVSRLDNADPIKVKLAQAVSLTPETLKDRLSWVLDNKYTELVDAVDGMRDQRPKVTGICEISDPQIEDGVIPPCRLCSPSDDPTKTTFIDSKQYGDNISFYCSINPTILDTIADAAVSTGVNLWQGITGGLTNILKYVGIAAAVIVGIVIVVVAIFLIIRNRRNKGDDTSSVSGTPISVYTQPVTVTA